MKTVLSSQHVTKPVNEALIPVKLKQNINEYYVEAGMDYECWSPGFNMHFGYGKFHHVFNRERMLERMTDEVFRRLNIVGSSHIIDLGCGMGASMRRGAAIFDQAHFTGLTIVPMQKEKGEKMNREAGLSHAIDFRVEDYHASSLASEKYNGLYAIESACYSPAHLQQKLILEMYRVLRPGARLVIADGFRKKQTQEFSTHANRLYNNLCANWAMPGMMHIGELKVFLLNAGFKNIVIEEISWKVAPSVLHIPFVILRFLMQKFLKGEKLSAQSIRNLKGSFQTLLLGLQRKNFGYFLISAEK